MCLKESIFHKGYRILNKDVCLGKMDIRLERWLWYSYFQSCAYIIPILCDMLVSKVLFHWLLAVRNRGKRQFSKQKLQEKNTPHLCVSGGTKHLFQKTWHACFLVAIVFRFAPLIYYRWNFSVINSTTWTAISTTPTLAVINYIHSRKKAIFLKSLASRKTLYLCNVPLNGELPRVYKKNVLNFIRLLQRKYGFHKFILDSIKLEKVLNYKMFPK